MPRAPRRVLLAHAKWRELGMRSRRQVRAAARRGHVPPEPYVAAVARAWAQEVARMSVRAPTARSGIIGSLLGAAVVVLIATVLDGVFAGGSVAYSRRERRLARRILALPPA